MRDARLFPRPQQFSGVKLDDVMTRSTFLGIVIEFSDGLKYTVGEGFHLRGRKLEGNELSVELRARWNKPKGEAVSIGMKRARAA